MHLAKVNGELVVAVKGLKGTCPHCGLDVLARCGEWKRAHWAHRSRKDCDSWQAGKETDWHLEWKKEVGLSYAEKRINKDGIYHIADICIPRKGDGGDLIIEFQNSPITAKEIRRREDFYGKGLIWVLKIKDVENHFTISRDYLDDYLNWSFEPRFKLHFENAPGEDNPYIITVPSLNYDKDYERFILDMGFVFDDSCIEVNEKAERRGYGMSLIRKYKKDCKLIPYSERYDYVEYFNSQKRMRYSKVISKRKTHRTSYRWKYAKLQFFEAKCPIFIDLNKDEIFQIQNGQLQFGAAGVLFRKEDFIARIRQRIREASELTPL